MYFEIAFDDTCNFLKSQFGEFTVRERQISKSRYEVLAVDPTTGMPRKIADLFEKMEGIKASLKVQEYSIAQTSLEQIFNQFASQQEEETGKPMIS